MKREGMCWRFNKCKIAGRGCEIEAANSCDLLKYVDKEIRRLIDKFNRVLKIKNPFSYDEEWYRNLKNRALKIMSPDEFQVAEDESIEMFLVTKKRNKGKGG